MWRHPTTASKSSVDYGTSRSTTNNVPAWSPGGADHNLVNMSVWWRDYHIGDHSRDDLCATGYSGRWPEMFASPVAASRGPNRRANDRFLDFGRAPRVSVGH